MLTRMSMGFVLLTWLLTGCNLGADSNQMPPIIFLGWDENENSQLYRQIPGKEPVKISDVEEGVLDFAVAPDGESIVFSTFFEDGSSAVWQINKDGRTPQKLLACEQVACRLPVWAPDSRRLIYERRDIGDDGFPGSPYLWWLDTETRETRAVLEDSEARGTAARFSADGRWLSYVSPEEEGALIINLEDGRSLFAADEIGVPAAWSPTAREIVVPNLDLVIIHGDEGEEHLEHTHDYETAVHLFKMDLESGESHNISGDLNVEDGVPAWSPRGEWIAFGRRFTGTSAGRQLWLMRPDGSEMHALTNDPALNYGPPVWSPDGRYLLYQRFSMNEPDGDPGIWLLNIETGHERELVSRGMQPAYLVEAPGD